MIKVYHHANPWAASTDVDRINKDLASYIYVKVAEVDTAELSGSNALEFAFEKTNTFEKCWWENQGVTKFAGDHGRRSTCIGDLMDLDGHLYVVDTVGFKKIMETL